MISATFRGLGIAMAAAMILHANIARAEDAKPTDAKTAEATTADAKTTEAGPEVHIDNFTFEPAQLTVKVGTTVTWTNRDDIPHTVVSAGKFRSKTMDTDGTFSFTFTAPGDYKYFCSLHPHMTGMVKVE
jgi:plastocyanin